MYFKKALAGRNEWYWYVLGMLAVVAGYILGSVPLVLVEWMQVKADKSITTDVVNEFHETMDFTLLNLSKNVGLTLMIGIFIFSMLAFMLVIKYFHQRPLKNIITPKSEIDYKKILFGFGFWFILGVIAEGIIALMYPETYYLNFKPMSWLILLLICVFLLPIQTSLEEFVFRGYLMPAFSLIAKNKWIPLLLSSILFGIIHSANPEVERFGYATMMSYYILAGLFLGLITILDDSLELALGVHAATNIFGAAFFSFDGSVLQTDSIVKASEINPYIMIATFLVSGLIFVLVCNKKYRWEGLKRLFEPIGASEQQDAFATNSSFDTLDSNY